MNNGIFPSLLISGLFGSLAFAAVNLVTRLIFRKNHSKVRYFMLILCLISTLIPIKIRSIWHNEAAGRKSEVVYVEIYSGSLQGDNSSTTTAAVNGNLKLDHADFVLTSFFGFLGKFSGIYVTAVLILLMSRLILYGIFCVKLRKSSVPLNVVLYEYSVKNVNVFKSGAVSSPVLVYMEKPCIFLPSFDMTDEEFSTCLLHETSHIRGKDIIVKLLSFIALGVHFYNPFIHMLIKEISRECEICCDMRAVSGLDRQKRKCYISDVLSLADSAVKSNTLTFGLSCSKKELERRFDMILNSKKCTTRKTAVVVSLCVVITMCTLIASGVFAGKAIAEKPEPKLITKHEHGVEAKSVSTVEANNVTEEKEKNAKAEKHLESTKSVSTDEPRLISVTKISPVLDSFKISHGFTENHKAVDYIAEKGENVYAGIDGKVTDTGFDSARGNYIDLTSLDGTTVLRYNHLYEVFAAKDGIISAGDIIASVGQTGRATGPHLHFEVEINGLHANPEPMFLQD